MPDVSRCVITILLVLLSHDNRVYICEGLTKSVLLHLRLAFSLVPSAMKEDFNLVE